MFDKKEENKTLVLFVDILVGFCLNHFKFKFKGMVIFSRKHDKLFGSLDE
jgi:hypothetical protein